MQFNLGRVIQGDSKLIICFLSISTKSLLFCFFLERSPVLCSYAIVREISSGLGLRSY